MKFETNYGLLCFLKFTAHFLLLIGHFLFFREIGHFVGKPNASLLVLKDLKPSRAEKSK
jgi:hypothetical protein